MSNESVVPVFGTFDRDTGVMKGVGPLGVPYTPITGGGGGATAFSGLTDKATADIAGTNTSVAAIKTTADTASSNATAALQNAATAQTTANAAVPALIAPRTEGSTVTLLAADNAGVSICPSACIVTVNTGLGLGFGRSFHGAGAVSFTGSAAIVDDRVTGSTAPSCALVCWSLNTYHVVGSKA